jgi:DNA modification methylase
MSYSILVGDALAVLRTLPSDHVQCVVTSPPYWGLRDYGVEGQSGNEPTPEVYIDNLVQVFREVRRLLRKDGTCWLNLGDSYAGYHGNKNHVIPTSSTNGWTNGYDENKRASAIHGTVKQKDLIGMPWRVALALQADGWYLRQDIIWAKSNPMPESVTDRCTKSHEYLFLLTKSSRYLYNSGAIKEPAVANHAAGNTSHRGVDAYEGGDEKHRTKGGLLAFAARNGKNSFQGQGHDRSYTKGPANRQGRDMAVIGIGLTRNKRSVWTIATQPFKGAHFATFPEKLVEPCILAGTLSGDLVLDPFCGSGTVGVVAQHYGRNFLGIELNPVYAGLAANRIERGSTKLKVKDDQ